MIGLELRATVRRCYRHAQVISIVQIPRALLEVLLKVDRRSQGARIQGGKVRPNQIPLLPAKLFPKGCVMRASVDAHRVPLNADMAATKDIKMEPERPWMH